MWGNNWKCEQPVAYEKCCGIAECDVLASLLGDRVHTLQAVSFASATEASAPASLAFLPRFPHVTLVDTSTSGSLSSAGETCVVGATTKTTTDVWVVVDLLGEPEDEARIVDRLTDVMLGFPASQIVCATSPSVPFS